jgi:uncharacterized glyoxalase superfamily protein PhnB
MARTNLEAGGLFASLTVNDVAKSLAFYRDGLGFTVKEEWKDGDVLQGVMLEAGKASLGISQDDFGKGRDRVKGVGMRLYLETNQDIEGLAAQAKSNGITLNDGPGPLPWGPIGFTVTDPDGFKLTISNSSEK